MEGLSAPNKGVGECKVGRQDESVFYLQLLLTVFQEPRAKLAAKL